MATEHLADTPVLDAPPPVGRNRSVLFLAVCALGVSAFLTQITLMRELLSVFSRQRTGPGDRAGQLDAADRDRLLSGQTCGRLRDGVAVLIAAQVLMAVLPIVHVFLLRTLRDVVFLRGAEVGVTETVVARLRAPGAVLPDRRLPADALFAGPGFRPGAVQHRPGLLPGQRRRHRRRAAVQLRPGPRLGPLRDSLRFGLVNSAGGAWPHGLRSAAMLLAVAVAAACRWWP